MKFHCRRCVPVGRVDLHLRLQTSSENVNSIQFNLIESLKCKASTHEKVLKQHVCYFKATQCTRHEPSQSLQHSGALNTQPLSLLRDTYLTGAGLLFQNCRLLSSACCRLIHDSSVLGEARGICGRKEAQQ